MNLFNWNHKILSGKLVEIVLNLYYRRLFYREKKIHTDLIACKNMLEKQMEEANEEQIQMNNPISDK